MADFNIKPIGTEVRPVQGASLADMVNVARGAQQYQQAAQINPLELQQKQQATRTGEITLGVAEQAEIERRNMQRFFSDPNNFQTDNRIDLDKINKVVPTIAPLTGAEYMSKFTTLGNAQTTAEKTALELNQADRELIANPISVLGYAGVKDPRAYAQVIKQTMDQNKNNQRLVSLGNSYLTQLEFADPNNLPDIAIRASQNLLSPAQAKTAFAPTIQTTESGKTVTTQPAIGATAPTATIGVAGGLQAPAQPSGAVGGPVGSGTEIAPGMRVPYPVRRADQPYMPEPSEAKDQLAGQAYREKLLEAQGTLSQGRRNVEEVIKQATGIGEDLKFPKGGIMGRLEQKVLMALKSDEYDMLAKDLANMALSNTKALGGVGNTVAGLDMQAVANGTIKVPTNVLVNIARRVQADQTNLDMQTNGARAFSQKFGDNNMGAFQQAWNANSKDTRIFEAMNLLENETNPNKLKTEFEKLFPSEQKRKTILKQYKNLKSLAATGVVSDKLED